MAVLWISAVLIAIITVTAKTIQLDSTLTRDAGERIRLKWAARAAIEKAVSLLDEDSLDSDSLNDLWNLDDSGDSELGQSNDIEIDNCIIDMQITDESSKFNLNKITTKQLMEFPEMTEDIAGSILDWRDKDDKISAGGAETGYYINLAPSYHIANSPFKTVRELLAVKDIEPQLLMGFQDDRELPEEFSDEDQESLDQSYGSLGITSDDTDEAEELYWPWIEALTCYSSAPNKDADSEKRVDINKASKDDMVKKLKISEGHAKWIESNRKNGFKSITDLIDENAKQKSGKKKDGKKSGDDKKQSKDPVPLDLATFKEIADKISVSDKDRQIGLINVNTAGRRVLKILLGNEQLADNIINERGNSLAGFDSIADLLNVKGMSIKKFKKVADKLTVRSNVFSINCTAGSTVTPTTFVISAVVDRGASPTEILYWYQEQ